MPSITVQDYLKAVYVLRSDDPVTAGAVAAHLGVRPAAVSAMYRRLAQEGLVSHHRYHGARLTEAGERVALDTLRRHRLVESYLVAALGMSWDQVHPEAEVLEHCLSDAMAERIAERLGNPQFDPHGDPIPTADGVVPTVPTRALADLRPSETAVVRRVSSHDPELLRYLAAIGVVPESRVTVVSVTPFGDDRRIRVGDCHYAVSAAVAHNVFVTRVCARAEEEAPCPA